jgi:hypothetical protein
MHKPLIALALAMLALFSCKTQEQAVKEVIREKDSINVSRVENYRDSTLMAMLKKESQKNAIVVSYSSGLMNSDTSMVAIEHAVSLAWVQGGKLFHTIETSKEQIPVFVPKAVKEVRTDTYKGRSQSWIKTVTIHTTTNILTKVQRFFIALGYCFAGVIMGAMVYFVYWLKNRITPTL